MKTIGILLKEARTRKRYSQARLEKETKIKKEFIEALEKEKWEELPELPVVQGFVKNIAQFLKTNEKRAAALLRRDYPPKALSINPKPDVSEKFTWSPKLTFIVGAILVSSAILGYLGFEYSKFVNPPQLEVYKPKEGEVVTEEKVKVSGKADLDVVVKVNNQPVLIDEEGKFIVEIGIFGGTEEVVVKAISRSGKETVIRRKIIPKLD